MSLLSRATVSDKTADSESNSMPPPPPVSPLSRATVIDKTADSESNSMPPPPPRAQGETSSSINSSPKVPVQRFVELDVEEEDPVPDFSFPGAAQITSSTDELRAPPARQKVPVIAGYSQMAWVFLGKKNRDLAGLKGQRPGNITMEEVKKHKKKDDAWMVLRGKVYNITPYIAYHPGGEQTLMSAAGKDGTKLYDKFHKWVNADFLMEKCLVGYLVQSEPMSASTPLPKVDFAA